MHTDDEQKLIKACMRNDRTAQRALYDRFAPYMMAIAIRYVGDYDTAQDVVQEAFIKVFASLNQYTAKGSLEGWVRRITVNSALEYLRSTDVFDSLDCDEVGQIPTMNITAIEKMSADELMNIIASLPAGYRTVFNMYAIEGYSHKEIAQIMGIQESSSRSQYIRAKLLIQKKIENLT
ncbi:MAG: RNA polymerase sigma factor [Bacteroidaceae bacterium]|nr:RNA polymerase sigma factor [Bacteroidaceae bacterium]MBQ6939406.1 RNA polymerase sigma factor [Muribaculaceae bacterium]